MKITSANPTVLCPEGRISKSVKKVGEHDVIDIQTYIPYFLVAVNNCVSRGASQYYLDNFGIGIVEWRTLSMLAIEPHIPASRICQVISLDKAATSRALKQLQGKGYADFVASRSDERKKTWFLSQTGNDLHDRIIKIALKRENHLINGADPEDLEAFLRVMRIMQKNMQSL